MGQEIEGEFRVVDAPEGRRAKEEPGPNHYRYLGTGSANNQSALPYERNDRKIIQADFIEVMAHGYTVDRAVRLLCHWATSPEWHVNIRGEKIDAPHPSFGRAVPARKTFYVWREDPQFAEFKEAWDEAIGRGTEALEDHALDLAYAGNDKLVMFLLKARNPTKYAQAGGPGGGSFQITITPGDERL